MHTRRLKIGTLMVFGLMVSSVTNAETIRIGTYNLRMQQLDSNTPDSWDFRHDKCIKSIMDNCFDVFGVQEISNIAKDQIAKDLKKSYASVFFSPYSRDGKGDKSSGIIYRKNRFKLIEYHFFWISDTPDEISMNDHYSINGSTVFSRGGACAIFKDRKTGKKFFFINHHGILNSEENQRYAHVLVEIEKRYNPDGFPSFLVGDFNARCDSPAHLIYRNYWSDSADDFGPRVCTLNRFNPDSESWDPARHIDFIYYRNTSSPVNYQVNTALYGGRCASDHFPVWADFVF